jgi:hypothetical protein
MFSIRSRLAAANFSLTKKIGTERPELLDLIVEPDETTVCKTAQVYTSLPLSVQPKESKRGRRKSGGRDFSRSF